MTTSGAPSGRLAAASVHVFTALGAVTALLAAMAVVHKDWQAMFGWLALALFIDGVDGTLARKTEVTVKIPDFSGERLDWIVDFLTYVFIPAFALIEAGFLSGLWGVFLASLMMLTSLYHFCDLGNKSDDGNFVGFPAVWNIIAFYIFVFEPGGVWTSLAILIFAALTFVPLKWVHPVRAKWARSLTLAVTVAACLASLVAMWTGFPPALWIKIVLALSAVYLVGVSLAFGMAR
ncbi:MAG: CDP-alcohol phosphatidyltransferase family protein [Methyloligellaceae bacterium]